MEKHGVAVKSKKKRETGKATQNPSTRNEFSAFLFFSRALKFCRESRFLWLLLHLLPVPLHEFYKDQEEWIYHDDTAVVLLIEPAVVLGNWNWRHLQKKEHQTQDPGGAAAAVSLQTGRTPATYL